MFTPTRDQPASPLPWETIWNDPSGVADADGSTIIGLHLLRHADAAYIVTACNAYPALVAALEKILAGARAELRAGERPARARACLSLDAICVAAQAALAQAGEV